MITIKQVSKTFLQGTQQVHALNAVDLHVPNGKIFGVIGASGAGKSTLIRMVNLLERPTRGQVFVDGVELTALSRTELGKMRQKIGMIFQHFNLLSSRTVFDNVAFPLELAKLPRAEINTRVTELLALVGLSDKHQSYPNKLSGGQKQRVAIARALAGAPKVLLCDEATSALDPATTHSILTLLQKINQQLGITILLITHEMDVIKRICHDLAVISGGKLIESGSVADIFANPKTELAQSFIRSTQHLTIPPEYADKLQPQNSGNLAPLVRIDFTGASVDAPIISQISRQFNIDVSILSSDIDYAGGVKFGHMLAEIFGQPEQIEQALAFLQQHHIDTEVLGYVA